MQSTRLLLFSTVSFFLLLCANLSLVTASTTNRDRSDTGRLLTCFSCTAENPSCRSTCRGRYCYKAEGLIDGERTVKRGCMNFTDSGVRASIGGPCEIRRSTTLFDIEETMCVCASRDRCNTATMGFNLLLIFITIALSLFTL